MTSHEAAQKLLLPLLHPAGRKELLQQHHRLPLHRHGLLIPHQALQALLHMLLQQALLRNRHSY
jgi:hypothetical protein